jgi:hypothetical protein
MTHTIEIEEGDRQLILLALAKLSVERPGFLDTIERIALTMDNRDANGEPQLLSQLRAIHAQPHPADLSTTFRSSLITGLTELLQLNNHYATLLNVWDGGERRTADLSTTFRSSLITGLTELLQLSNHYATLLNMWDGGERRTFATTAEWIGRLVETGKIRVEDNPLQVKL